MLWHGKCIQGIGASLNTLFGLCFDVKGNEKESLRGRAGAEGEKGPFFGIRINPNWRGAVQVSWGDPLSPGRPSALETGMVDGSGG